MLVVKKVKDSSSTTCPPTDEVPSNGARPNPESRTQYLVRTAFGQRRGSKKKMRRRGHGHQDDTRLGIRRQSAPDQDRGSEGIGNMRKSSKTKLKQAIAGDKAR